MKSKEIRKAFLEYFQSKGHTVVRSAPLIPRNDPTLLFVNAGMVQFKTVFLGEESRPYSRAASCQKCLRAGGKHSDIENVGHTARHHTFFEMLGNFSFGDYFKRDAIHFAWELLTDRFKLPKEKLWVSIYEEDDEAGRLWTEHSDVRPGQIVRLGAKDNFWQMADTGPCGPCSEIIIDRGEAFGCGRETCSVGCDCDRYLEIWNLVFMQFNRDETGKLNPLPKPSIDTGMGLERISSVMQNTNTNFDTDIFQTIIRDISSLAGVSYGSSPDKDASLRVIADHLRSITFLISDGLTPSNEGRGYVMRRIIRRASRHAKLLGIHDPCLYKLIDSVVSSMGDIYPEIVDEQSRAEKLLMIEEERFIRTVETGMNKLDEIIARVKKSGGMIIPGDEVFKLYDTFGFPVDLARDMAIDAGMKVDEEVFQAEMAIQRERARASWVGEDEAVASIYRELISEAGKTEFTGYDSLESSSVIKAIVKDGKVIKEAAKGDEVEIFLDKTPFYGESGGQVGDIGELSGDNFSAAVTDTRKPLEGFHSHIVKVKRGTLKVWDTVTCRIDAEARKQTMRNHTSTHLLHKILQSVAGEHVRQAGSLVSPEKLRFDFTHFTALSDDEISIMETMLNEKILENLPVVTSTMDIQSAVASGAMALFGEKYGDTVRVVNVQGFSSELCGGTHCRATGEIGLFVIVSEGSVASGIRRIEALTGKAALVYLMEKKTELDNLKNLLKTEKPIDRIEKLLDDMKSLEKKIKKLNTGSTDFISQLLKDAREHNGVRIVSGRHDELNQDDLRNLADAVKDRIQSGIIVVSSVSDGKASIVCMVTKDIKNKYPAGKILKRFSEISGGSGGGKPELAQGGTKDIEKLAKALDSVYDIVKSMG
jgi:alanyl-tRNA synthetase